MKRLTITLCCSVLCFCASSAEDQVKLIFQDQFDRTETQEVTDEIGNGWGTNSKTRAGGNKQVDLREGAMYIYIHETADHAVSVTHPAEFRDGRVEIRFMLEHPQDRLGLNFADLQYKKVWAGHLFKVDIGTKELSIADLKTGAMDLQIREARQSNQLSPEQSEMLKKKSVKFAHPLDVGKWYTAVATIQDDTLRVTIDGNEVGSFSSPGVAHPTKRMLRLAVPRNAVVDEVAIYSADN